MSIVAVNEMSLLHLPSMSHCNLRLRTFDKWSENGKPSKTEMAKAGFMSLGYEDWVQCVFCGVRIYDWQPHDVAYTEHRKFSGQCPYLLMTDLEPVAGPNNVTLNLLNSIPPPVNQTPAPQSIIPPQQNNAPQPLNPIAPPSQHTNTPAVGNAFFGLPQQNNVFQGNQQRQVQQPLFGKFSFCTK
jgi:hypothetical protein